LIKVRKRGQSIIELAVGIIVLVPIVLVLFDLAVLVLGVGINDSVCRDAARAAASGSPTDIQARAEAIINRMNAKSSSMLSNFKLIGCKMDGISQQDIQNAQQFGGPVTGTVTVTTEVEIRPFVVKVVYQGDKPLVFRARQCFPFTFVFPMGP
jgi:uncharacterized protein (UPF0333 family)